MVGLIALVLASWAFLLGAGLCAIARRVAPRLGLVDNPGGRKAHEAPTPLGGGFAIWLSLILVLGGVAAAAWFGRAYLPEELGPYVDGAWSRAGRLALLLGLATAIMTMGLLDDRFALGWRVRILVQFGLAAAFVLAGEQATLFQSNRWVAAGVTIVWIVGLTNAFNFLDNMDGLAASVGLIAALLFIGAQVAVGSLFVPAVLVVLAGALLGFLVHNRPPARLFMGDSGSNLLGFLLGTLTVEGTFTREGFSPLAVMAPLLVMAVPLYDTASVILIRIREGRSPFQPDRSHFSHRLVDRGLTPPLAVLTIDLVTLAAGLGALLLHRVQEPIEAAIILGQTISVLGIVAVLEAHTSRRERRHAQAPSEAGKPPNPNSASESRSRSDAPR
jgi:UDP-GlcNAc:undecaprenyl-phosphate GlcNAc-1-phosphate transferase